MFTSKRNKVLLDLAEQSIVQFKAGADLATAVGTLTRNLEDADTRAGELARERDAYREALSIACGRLAAHTGQEPQIVLAEVLNEVLDI